MFSRKLHTVQSLKAGFSQMIDQLKTIQETESTNVEKAELEVQRATLELQEASRFRAKLEDMVK